MSKKALLLVLALFSIAPVLQGASDVTIQAGVNKGGKLTGRNPKIFKPTKATARLSRGSANATLNASKGLTVRSDSTAAGNGDIIVGLGITKSKGRTATLTLEAVRDILVNTPIICTRNSLPMVFKAGRAINSKAAITTNNGNLAIDTSEPFVVGGPINAGTGNLLLQSGTIESTEPQTVKANEVQVFSGATWRLRGTIDGNVSVAGVLSPAQLGIGSIKVNGAITFHPQGVLAINLGGTGRGTTYGSVEATNAIALNGTLQLDCVSGFEDTIINSHKFTILQGNSITGTFTGLPDGARVFLPDELGSLRISYKANSVELDDWQPVLIDPTWDPGEVDEGTFVYTNTRIRGRRHYFRVHAQATDIGAWRTRLTPVDGEANLYISRTGLPTLTSNFRRSEYVGPDGFVLNPTEYQPGQEWFLLVFADPGKPWKFVTGRAYVQELGTLGWTDTDSSGTYNIGEAAIPSATGDLTIGGEGMRFFKATVPVGTPAWSLWLSGSDKDIAIRKSIVPFHSAATLYDRKQSGQMLVVPSYLGSGLTSYFLSVVGKPGETVNLDSRIQEVTDIGFNTTINNISVTDAPYRVYRVQVPINEIAWDVSTLPVVGDPNVAIRRDLVPAEFDNDAFSEVGNNVSDSITLVPNFLTDGTWYITVYGKSPYGFTLRNGPPEVTPIQFTDTKINDQPDRTGWRFYAVTDIPAQLGVVGWELQLAQQVQNTELAIRRNAVPSRWRSRKDGKPLVVETAASDFSGKEGFLQRPGHQADIWYIGVYIGTEKLGSFKLDCYPMSPPTIALDGGTKTLSNLEPGRFGYVRIDVPPGIQGWDVRITGAGAASPGIAVRRDQLPSLDSGNRFVNLPAWNPHMVTAWPTDHQWVGGIDWTGHSLNGPSLPVGNRLVMGTGRPLEPGTYYVGVYNNSAVTLPGCTIDSRGIGAGQTYPVTSLEYVGGTSAISNLAPREARYFKVSIPAGQPSWELLLDTTAPGEAEMVVRYGTIPDFAALAGGDVNLSAVGREIEMAKVGPERYVLLPPSGMSTIEGGDYYIAVVSQGVNPTATTVGTGPINGTITSVGPLLEKNLGTVSETTIEEPVSLVPGQYKAYHFDVPEDTISLEVRLDQRENAPGIAVIASPILPEPAGTYGVDGGTRSVLSAEPKADSLVLTVGRPVVGKWSIIVNAGTLSDARAVLRIKALFVTPLGFDGATIAATGHAPATVRYYSVVVPDDAVGWDIRLRDVSSPGGAFNMPTMSVCRGDVNWPHGFYPPGWRPWTDTVWDILEQWPAGGDWTGYTVNPASAGGSSSVPPRLVSGRGRPLVPGKYYIAVYNSTNATTSIDYTIDSRGIGPGFTYPVPNLDFAGGNVDINNLAPREARYFKVTIPPNTQAWEVTLSKSAGEMTLSARQGAIPDFAVVPTGSVYRADLGVELKAQKTGPERYVLFHPEEQTSIPAGDYYLAVVGEGEAPTGATIGSGASSGVLQSGPFITKNLGVASASGTTEHVELVGGQVKAYSFTVPEGTDSLEVKLANKVGVPWISLISGGLLPKAPGEPNPLAPPIGASPANDYGCDGGSLGLADVRLLTVANPAAGEWRVVVRAGHSVNPVAFPPAEADLVVTALKTVPVEYDGGVASVNSQEPGTWRYFVVEVPPGVAGWDVRMKDVSGPLPAMMVRRDVLPDVPSATEIPGNIPASWTPWRENAWLTKNQWLAGIDWTGYQLDAAGVSVPPRLVAGMGRPLEAGTYYIGVYNNTLSQTSYKIDSRGIGEGRIYPVTELPFAGGSATIADLPRREAQYFKVTIPIDTPSWEVTLDSTVGEVELLARLGAIPDFHAVREGTVYGAVFGGEVEMKKAGPERYVLLPDANGTTLTAGTYYLAVVSEGVNPSASTVGAGTSSGILTSLGILPVSNLGTATAVGISESVVLAGSQMKAYQFSVAPGTKSLEMRLNGTVGYPVMRVIDGTRLPVPGGISPIGVYPHTDYGFDGGTGGVQNTTIHSVSNPKPGLWSVIVRARHDPVIPVGAPDAVFPAAEAQLLIKSKANIPLNFAESLNSSGGSHTDTRQATDGEYNIYEVSVPSTLDGQSILGWIIHTEVTQGAVALEVYKDFANPTGGITISTGIAVVVPPFLTFNETWYIRVKATGLTNYKITSRPVLLERPAWQMPAPHNQTFGDTGTDISGNPLPGDRGVDLQEGNWHFYAIDVPEDNSGLLRTELQAISGNPDLYLREDGVPSIHHLSNGKLGVTLAPRKLTGATTSYGNWVPLDSKLETRLRPGRWYLGVHAGSSSNVRYRLISSTGIVTPLALNPATATAQVPNSVTEHSLADNDWRYYRFQVPAGAPRTWNLTFNQHLGNVVMWIRDTVPPGQKGLNLATTAEVLDWGSDARNTSTYKRGYDLPATHPLTTPPLRPGHVYYVGFRSSNSATFSLSSDTDGTLNPGPSLDFYTGTVTTTVPANESVSYRVPVPPEGTRFKYTSTHSTAIRVRIEQGTVPGTGQHFISALNATNSSMNQDLYTKWPWLPNYTYYVEFVNSSDTPQPITFTLSGKNAQTDDNDGDGLLDAWERQYFNGLTQSGTGDPDGDGVNNATEFADGTVPNDASSAKYALTVLARNGTAEVTPVQTKYDKGTVVSLTATPNPDANFVSWIGGPFKADDFALKATGTITIPASGVWTFGVNASDGSRLLVNGVQLFAEDAPHLAPFDKFAEVNLPAGSYPIEVVCFENAAGEGLELFAAPGSFTAFGPDFRLVGDVANGGLAVQTVVNGASTPGFTVRQVESLSTDIPNLTAATNLLNGTIVARKEITGVIDVLNFLNYDLNEGHFGDNALFPLSAAIEDNPLSLAINGSYTITALNSIPLGTALDAEALTWQTGSNAPWIGENDVTSADGVDSVSSGPIGDSESSYIQTVVTGPGTITFKWKVSSQAAGDILTFLVDGVSKASTSGEKAWASPTPVSFAIGAGVHTLTWRYTKNAGIATGTDRAWLDQVVFTP